MQKIVPLFLAVVLIPGCSVFERIVPKRAEAPAPVVEAPVDPVPSETAVAPMGATGATTAAALDQTTTSEKKEALAVAPTTGERDLGRLAVSLGNPAEQGFWLRTTLVTAAGKGRVETSGGQSVAVDLLPGESGAQLSLAAFRALGLNLTDLPEVSVFAN
jgi:hypothetical protein